VGDRAPLKGEGSTSTFRADQGTECFIGANINNGSKSLCNNSIRNIFSAKIKKKIKTRPFNVVL
jgi:hypothetical protein